MKLSRVHILITGSTIVLLAATTSYVLMERERNMQAGMMTTETFASSSQITSTAEMAASTSPESTKPFGASLAEVMASGKNYGCHYMSPSEEGHLTGTIFVSEGRARGTIIGDIFNAPGSLVSFLLNKGHTYLWYTSDGFDEQMQGKALLVEAKTTKEKMEIEQDIKKNLENLYGCVPWEFEPDFFELPRDIQFIDHTGKAVTP